MGLFKRKASYRLTDSGLTYFSRKTFDVALGKLGASFPDREWHTVAEMMHVLDGTGYGVAIAIVPMDDVWSIGDGDKELRVVDLRSPSGQERADEERDGRLHDVPEPFFLDMGEARNCGSPYTAIAIVAFTILGFLLGFILARMT